jgi:type II secretory ATPase GspE/PulE/Tfp pilus assembly ATPase PilB-like protein
LQPVGCDACHATGFSGRIAIAELVTMSEEKRELILAGADPNSKPPPGVAA